MDDNVLICCIVIAILFYLLLYFYLSNKRTNSKLSRTQRELYELERGLNSKEKDLADLKKALDALETNLSSQKNELFVLENNLSEREKALAAKEEGFDLLVHSRVISAMTKSSASVRSRPYFSDTSIFHTLAAPDSLENPRLIRALNEKANLAYPLQISTQITGHDGVYTVTLNDCTCEDYHRNRKPCKHMFRLALEVGAYLSINEEKLERFFERYQEESEKASIAAAESRKAAALLSRKKEFLHQKEIFVNSLLNESEQRYPWFSSFMADFYKTYDNQLLKELQARAKKTARELKPLLKGELRQMRYALNLAEHQLAIYESLFPWLLDFKELSPEDAVAAARVPVIPEDHQQEHELFRHWLSDTEFTKLTDSEKYQLALDRWSKRPRTNWEAGIDYERYIGYLYELDGYYVTYFGALQKKEDMGRDIIAKKENLVHIVQCKRYRAEREIHENVVFQLYGSAVAYQIDHPDLKVVPVICTSASLSDVARRCAEYLHIVLREDLPLPENYPLIKCNIGRTGNRIYHLPIDQQYDRVHIDPASGECYAHTVAEAEALGFRRAYRWKS